MEGDPKGLTAGIIIIGDEILKGHVQDANSHYLCHQLWLLGIKVCKIVVVPDVLDSIAEEVKRFTPAYDFVLTTGGIGPTHDDVTLAAVGKAFGEELYPHPDILQLFFGEGKDDPSNPWRKMAIVPKSTKVVIRLSFLLFVVHNVHCYPGVPSLLKDVFQQCQDLYSQSGTRFYLKEVFFSCGEDVLAKPLAQLQKEFETVQLGSYPDDSSSHSYRVKVTLECSDKELVEKTFSRLLLLMPKGLMSSKDNYDSAPRQELSWLLKMLPGKRESLVPADLVQRIHESINLIEKALEQYRFDELCVAFNGGKDCTVMLALFYAILQRRKHNFSESHVKVLYIVRHEAFPEIEEFIEEASRRYSLDIIHIPGTIREALSTLKTSHPTLKAVLMGTRHTDPYSGDLKAFAPTDSSWPEYMRVNCILEWSYHHVWLFLKLFQVPYCKLYDQGYTSLDGMVDTHPNPALLLKSPTKEDTNCEESPADKKPIASSYLPAYMLTDEGLERAGRTQRT